MLQKVVTVKCRYACQNDIYFWKNYHSCLARHKNYSHASPRKIIVASKTFLGISRSINHSFLHKSPWKAVNMPGREREREMKFLSALVKFGPFIYNIYNPALRQSVSFLLLLDKKQQENRRRNLSLAACAPVCIYMLSCWEVKILCANANIY